MDERDVRIFTHFKKRCNRIIFKEIYHEGITIKKLKKELEYKGISPCLVTDTVLTKLIFKDFQNKGLKITQQGIFNLIREAIEKKFLFKWGEDKMYVVTKELLEYLKTLESPFIKFEIKTHEEDF